MIHFIIGANGSGKTACIPSLKQRLPNFTLYDFDDIGVPDQADTKWRQEATESWINRLTQQEADHHSCLLGQMVPAVIICSPSAKRLQDVHITLLDCSDEIRIQRLRKRGDNALDQNTLNWASWLRMHCKDPRWQQHVIKDNSAPTLVFDRWDQLENWPCSVEIHCIDTSYLSIDQVANSLMRRIQSTTNLDNNDTEIVFTEASLLDIDAMIELLNDDTLGNSRESLSDKMKNKYFDAFNRIQADINAKIIIASHNNVAVAMAQINFIQNLTYQGGVRAQIEGVRVRKDYRRQGIGKRLFQYLISLSNDRNCHMVQLTTNKSRSDAFDFYKDLGFIDSHEGFKRYLD
jgi:ribosomal protein S18 acetylase RimI-like enzyme